MKTKNIPRLMITGTGSGSGKTTVTCGLLGALKSRNLKVGCFKSGPDYIDPMFHKEILGIPSRNLDLFLCSEKTTSFLFCKNTANMEFALIEGAMGIYDGIGQTSLYSANHLAEVLKIPQILVVPCDKEEKAILTEINNFFFREKNRIRGIILNRIPPKIYPSLKRKIEKKINIPVVGYLPDESKIHLSSRHLGLVTSQEVEKIEEWVQNTISLCNECIDLDQLSEIANSAESIGYDEIKPETLFEKNTVKIGIAYDKAFCFYYEDNFELLKELGAELVFFSPLKDQVLPADLDGLIFGGGYPELHAKQLSENQLMKEDILCKSQAGIPIWAECGGFMYLGKDIKCQDDTFSMVGALDVHFEMKQKMGNFGYITLRAEQDSWAVKQGEEIKAHEFHYSRSSDDGGCFTARKYNGTEWKAIQIEKSIWAGYPHIHLWGAASFAQNFLRQCLQWKEGCKV